MPWEDNKKSWCVKIELIDSDGSGIIVSDQGHILTCYHNIRSKNCEKIINCIIPRDVTAWRKGIPDSEDNIRRIPFEPESLREARQNDLFALLVKDAAHPYPPTILQQKLDNKMFVHILGYDKTTQDIYHKEGEIEKIDIIEGIYSIFTNIRGFDGLSGGGVFTDNGELIGVIRAKHTWRDNCIVASPLFHHFIDIWIPPVLRRQPKNPGTPIRYELESQVDIGKKPLTDNIIVRAYLEGNYYKKVYRAKIEIYLKNSSTNISLNDIYCVIDKSNYKECEFNLSIPHFLPSAEDSSEKILVLIPANENRFDRLRPQEETLVFIIDTGDKEQIFFNCGPFVKKASLSCSGTIYADNFPALSFELNVPYKIWNQYISQIISNSTPEKDFSVAVDISSFFQVSGFSNLYPENLDINRGLSLDGIDLGETNLQSQSTNTGCTSSVGTAYIPQEITENKNEETVQLQSPCELSIQQPEANVSNSLELGGFEEASENIDLEKRFQYQLAKFLDTSYRNRKKEIRGKDIPPNLANNNYLLTKFLKKWEGEGLLKLRYNSRRVVDAIAVFPIFEGLLKTLEKHGNSAMQDEAIMINHTHDVCCLCQNTAQIKHLDNEKYSDVYSYSCRICGEFLITHELRELKRKMPQHLISGYIRNKSTKGEKVFLSTKNIEHILHETTNLTLSNKKDNLLELLYLRQKYDGAPLGIIPSLDYPLSYAKNEQEFNSHLKFLLEEGLLAPKEGDISKIHLTAKGIESFEKARKAKASKQSSNIHGKMESKVHSRKIKDVELEEKQKPKDDELMRIEALIQKGNEEQLEAADALIDYATSVNYARIGDIISLCKGLKKIDSDEKRFGTDPTLSREYAQVITGFLDIINELKKKKTLAVFNGYPTSLVVLAPKPIVDCARPAIEERIEKIIMPSDENQNSNEILQRRRLLSRLLCLPHLQIIKIAIELNLAKKEDCAIPEEAFLKQFYQDLEKTKSFGKLWVLMQQHKPDHINAMNPFE